MKKLQTAGIKNLVLALGLVLILPTISKSQDLDYSLRVADSLFVVKKYTESFQIYESIFETGEMTSPSMLLRMAYIKEGLNDYTNALYYLNLYYLEQPSDEVLEKMSELAAEHNLTGYEFTEWDVILNYYVLLYEEILVALFALSVLLLGMIILKKAKSQKRPTGFGITYVLVTAVLFYLLNFGQVKNRGIILNGNSYIMSGPSSGSDVIDIAKKGHKVKMLKKNDVWVQIEWGSELAYIKQKNIKAITMWN